MKLASLMIPPTWGIWRGQIQRWKVDGGCQGMWSKWLTKAASVWEDKKVLGKDVSDGCPTVGVFLTQLKLTLKNDYVMCILPQLKLS